ncbi:nucleotide disphospho-sugar-binding domain-containing protein [Thermoactinospora rubra]|uniref:nucleotide disphospho-sugar-binding domain-containing protein n=1 Tax=Thermoactinospora rubra TaxID=1088767 RepID=UPI001F0A468A|nr:nucleotide disphospho-sugar-binding domain-containing protein [Thermoactinospora rubra]
MLIVFPTRTHVYSMAPVGWALRAAGHEVRYVGPRNPAEIEPFLETGLESMWFGADLDIARERKLGSEAMDGPYKLSESRPERYTEDYVRSVYHTWAGVFRWTSPDRLLEELLQFARQWRPDLVVWDPMMYAGPLVAHAVGAAHVRMLYAADQTARISFQYQELGEPDPVVAWMADWLGRHGCTFDDSLRFGMATIDPSPSYIRYDLDVDYIPVRFVPVNRPLPIPRWVVEPPSRPRVLLTLGVSNRQVHGREEASVAALLEGLRPLDVEVIATLSADQLAGVGRVPDNVRAVDFVPMNEALATCSAIVHQGGGATIGNAVINGVPQLIVPGTTWSERASALAQEKRGNGLLLDLEDVTPEAVRDRVERLICEPSFARCAAEVQQEMLATPTLSEIVPDLEAMCAK